MSLLALQRAENASSRPSQIQQEVKAAKSDINRASSQMLSVRIAKSSSYHDLQPQSSSHAESSMGKFSPPPIRQKSGELQRQASTAWTSSIAGHRKRQMSVSSLDNIDIDAVSSKR